MSQPLSAGDLCTRVVVVAHRDMPLTKAARLMRQHHIGCLVVVDETQVGRMPVGLLTDRDIVTAVVAQDVDARTLRVEDVMSPEPVTVREDDSLLDALSAMRRAGVRRVPVTDARGVLEGLLALDDVMELLGEEVGALVQVLSSQREREPKRRP
jgi:CBS domain-containing protein